MIYFVDFCIRTNGDYHTICTEGICALSVSECREQAEEILRTLPESKNHEIKYFIEA